MVEFWRAQTAPETVHGHRQPWNPGHKGCAGVPGAWWIRMEGIPMEIIPPPFSLIPRLAWPRHCPVKHVHGTVSRWTACIRAKGAMRGRYDWERNRESFVFFVVSTTGSLAKWRKNVIPFAESRSYFFVSFWDFWFEFFYLVWFNWRTIFSMHLYACNISIVRLFLKYLQEVSSHVQQFYYKLYVYYDYFVQRKHLICNWKLLTNCWQMECSGMCTFINISSSVQGYYFKFVWQE